MDPSASSPPFSSSRRTLLCALAGAGLNAGCAVLGTAAHGCLRGTFWQPVLADLERDASQWRQWADTLAQLGLRRLIIQHVALEPYDVLVPRTATAREAVDRAGLALQEVLDLAHARGIRVWLGLSVDPTYFDHVSSSSDAQVRHYLGQRLARTLALAHALRPALAHAAVRGWYVGDEIDDLNWARPVRTALLQSWLLEVTEGLARIAPHMPIAISGFVNAELTPPAALVVQWRRWFEAAPRLDELLFQDGVGAGKVPLADSERYLTAIAEVAASWGRRFTPVVELFEPVPGQPPGTFRSADARRVHEQLNIVRRVATDWVTFSVPDYVMGDVEPARALRRGLSVCAALDRRSRSGLDMA